MADERNIAADLLTAIDLHNVLYPDSDNLPLDKDYARNTVAAELTRLRTENADLFNWRGAVSTKLCPSYAGDISRGRALELLGELMGKPLVMENARLLRENAELSERLGGYEECTQETGCTCYAHLRERVAELEAELRRHEPRQDAVLRKLSEGQSCGHLEGNDPGNPCTCEPKGPEA